MLNCFAGLSVAEDWYVSHSGRDSPCGSSRELACKELRFVIDTAGDGDRVFVDGSTTETTNSTRTKLYSMCSGSGNSLQNFSKSILLVGENGQPRIGCQENFMNEVIIEVGDSNLTDNCKLTMQNVEIENGVLEVVNCALEVVNCTVIDVFIITKFDVPCNYITIVFNQTIWFGQVKYTNGSLTAPYFTRPSEIICNSTDLLISQSRFFQNFFIFESLTSSSAYISDSVFSNTDESLVRMGGLRLKYGAASHADIVIRNCLFEKQLEISRLESLMNLHKSALIISSSGREKVDCKVILDNIQFKNNARGLSLVGSFASVQVNNSLFAGNIAKHAGAGTLIFGREIMVLFDNCTFINNTGGKARNDYAYEDPNTEVSYDGHVMHVNSSNVFGRVGLVGKGGAMRVQRGQVTISNSRFVNNTACLAGGSIFADKDSKVTLENTSLESSPVGDLAYQGDLVFSRSERFVFRNVSLIARKAKDGGSIVIHSGDHWSMRVQDVWVECPRGFNLKIVNSSAYGVSPHGLRKAHDVDTLQYVCELCGNDKYSSDFGYLNYTLQTSNFAGYHLVVDGDRGKLNVNHVEVYDHHKISCLDCPYGGECQGILGARPNFWGFDDNLTSTISFQHCPVNYCCPSGSGDCIGYSDCAKFRHGRLCGKCEDGYSEAIFWTKCVTDAKCSPAWYWSVIVTISAMYFLFILFIPVLNGFVFSRPCGLSLCCREKISQSFKAPSKTMAMSELEENVENQSNDESHQDDTVSIQTVTKNPFSYTIYLILFFCYIQDSFLLDITDYGDQDTKLEDIFQSLIAALFTFRINFPFAQEVCVFASMTSVEKVFVQFFPTLFILCTFFVVYFILKITVMIRSRLGSSDDDNDKIKVLCGYLVAGFVLSILLFYQFLAISTFQLLNCVSLQSDNVLFLDGTITCFQYWQYGVMVYAVLCVLPMCVVFLLGPSLMTKGFVQPWQFIFACIFPLPFTIWWLVQTIQTKGRLSNVWFQLNEETKGVVENLRVPFKENSDVCWLGVLLSGRLILVFCGVFILDSLIKLFCMLLICVSLLLIHAIVKPYRDKFTNFIGILCWVCLAVLCCVNLVQAFFQTSGTAPSGPLYFLMQILYHVKSWLIVWLPCIFVICAFFVVMIRATVCLTEKLYAVVKK